MCSHRSHRSDLTFRMSTTGSASKERISLHIRPSQQSAGQDLRLRTTSPGSSKRSARGLRRTVQFDPQLDEQRDNYQEEKKLKRSHQQHGDDGIDLENSGKERPRMSLKKDIDVLGCLAILTGTVFGAGILGKAHIPVALVDSYGVALLLWLVVGIVVVIAAMIQVEIGLAHQVSGGEYTFMFLLFGPAIGTMYQYAAMFYLMPLNLATLATVGGRYILALIPPADNAERNMICFHVAAASLGVIAIIIATAICCYSTHTVNIVATLHLISKGIITVLLIGLFIAHLYQNGFTWSNFEDWHKFHVTPPQCDENPEGPLFCRNATTLPEESDALDQAFAVSEAIYLIFYSYQGCEVPFFIIEELESPEIVLPRGMLISMSVIVVVYVVFNLCYMAVLSKAELRCARTVASDVFNKVVPACIPIFIPVLVSFSTFGTLVLYLHCYGRVMLVAARNGHTPKFFSLIHFKRLTPIPCVLTLSIMAVIYCILCVFFFAIFSKVLTYMWVFTTGLIIAGNINWRLRCPHVRRPYKVPLALQFIPWVSIGILVVVPFISADWAFKRSFVCGWRYQALILLGMVSIAALYPVYYFMIKRQWKGNTLERALVIAENRTAIFLQKLFLLVEEDCSDPKIS